MQISPSIIAAAQPWGHKELAASALPGEGLTRVREVVDLLAGSTSPGAQPGARRLFQQTAAGMWRVVRGAHRSQDDATLHVTVEVAGGRYHLRLDGQGYVFDITRVRGGQTQRLSGYEPWAPPGR